MLSRWRSGGKSLGKPSSFSQYHSLILPKFSPLPESELCLSLALSCLLWFKVPREKQEERKKKKKGPWSWYSAEGKNMASEEESHNCPSHTPDIWSWSELLLTPLLVRLFPFVVLGIQITYTLSQGTSSYPSESVSISHLSIIFNKLLLGINHVTGTVPGDGNIVVTKPQSQFLRCSEFCGSRPGFFPCEFRSEDTSDGLEVLKLSYLVLPFLLGKCKAQRSSRLTCRGFQTIRHHSPVSIHFGPCTFTPAHFSRHIIVLLTGQETLQGWGKVEGRWQQPPRWSNEIYRRFK